MTPIIKAAFWSFLRILSCNITWPPATQLQSAIVPCRIAKETVCVHHALHRNVTTREFCCTQCLWSTALSECLESQSDICKVPPSNIEPPISSCCSFSLDSITDDVMKDSLRNDEKVCGELEETYRMCVWRKTVGGWSMQERAKWKAREYTAIFSILMLLYKYWIKHFRVCCAVCVENNQPYCMMWSAWHEAELLFSTTHSEVLYCTNHTHLPTLICQFI